MKNLIPNFESFRFAMRGDTVYVNHYVDSLIYVYLYPDELIYTMGLKVEILIVIIRKQQNWMRGRHS